MNSSLRICVVLVFLNSAALAQPVVQSALSPHPILPAPSSWPAYFFRATAALFVLAAVIGPILRKEAPQDLPPPTHSHDEPPGSSHHHGPSGTRDITAPD
jgi:hypothetical protein